MSELDAYFSFEPIIKQVSLIEQKCIKPSLFDGFATPRKTYQSLVERLLGPMSFDKNIMHENKITKVPIILEEELFGGRWILYQKLRRKYPPKSLFFDGGPSFQTFLGGRAWRIVS